MARGCPGRRPGRTKRAAEAMATDIAAAEAAEQEPLALPQEFRLSPKGWERAARIWTEQVAALRSVGRAQPTFRYSLARYCIWSQIFISASEQLRRECPKGDYAIDYETGHGARKKTKHPSLEIMKDAETILRLLDHEFGFTPRSEADLTRVDSFNAAQARLPLSGGGPRLPGDPAPPAVPSYADDPTDLMTSTDSPGPNGLN